MSAEIRWTGLDEFKIALRNLPAEMRDEASAIVENATLDTASQLVAAYPTGDTGKLRQGVKHKLTRSEYGVIGEVRSSARHAHLWEWGTQSRKTKQGWNRGLMPSAKARGLERLVTIAQRNRRKMHQGLLEVVRRAGFTVTGSPDEP